MMIKKYGIFERGVVDDMWLGKECFVKLDEISVDRLHEFKGKTNEEKLASFIQQSANIPIHTNCKIMQFTEYEKFSK